MYGCGYRYKMWIKTAAGVMTGLFLLNTVLFADVGTVTLSPAPVFSNAVSSAEMQAAAICALIEKRAQEWEDATIEDIYVDDMLLWKRSTDHVFDGIEPVISADKREITISIPGSSVLIRYYDPAYMSDRTLIPYTDWRRTRTKSITGKINRQIIFTTEALQESGVQGVLDMYENVRDRSIDLPAHITDKRDEVYGKIHSSSETIGDERFKAVYDLVEYIYGTVDPLNEYTLETDRRHYKDVLELVLESDQDADISLKIAALLHDIERYMPGLKVSGLKEKRLDAIRKRAIHPLNSARIADLLLEGAGLSVLEKEKVRYLIEHHDAGGDEISLAGRRLVARVNEDDPYYEDVNTLTNADSMAFFKRTIKPFIKDRMSKGEPMDKILSRIAMLYNRIKSEETREKVKKEMGSRWKHRDPEVFDAFCKALVLSSGTDSGDEGNNEQAYMSFLEVNTGLISTFLVDSGEDILLRVPVEILGDIDTADVKDFFDAFQRDNSNGYIELFHASGDAADESAYGLRQKPADFKSAKETTITLMPVFKGEISADERQARRDIEHLVRTRLGPLRHNETQVVPVGYQNDTAGCMRGTVLGLIMMHIARESNEGRKTGSALYDNGAVSSVLSFYGPGEIERVGLSGQDIMALAAGDINDLVPVLKKLIELLPAEPVDARRIYENTRQVWMAA